MISVFENELVESRKLMTRSEFLSFFAMSRIVPSGSVAAMAVGVGYRYKNTLGAIIALLGILLPGFTFTVILAAFYTRLAGTYLFDLLNVSVLPAAMGFIIIAAIQLGNDVYHSRTLIFFACLAFIATLFLHISPAVVLVSGGIVSIILMRYFKQTDVTI